MGISCVWLGPLGKRGGLLIPQGRCAGFTTLRNRPEWSRATESPSTSIRPAEQWSKKHPNTAHKKATSISNSNAVKCAQPVVDPTPDILQPEYLI